jgi:hypothetical protein
MSDQLAKVWDVAVEKPLDKVGLLNNTFKRFIVFTVGGAAILYGFKPSAMFDPETKKPYPSLLFDQGVNAIPINWLTASVGIGLASILFI